MSTNATISAAEIASSVSVCVEPQPSLIVSTSAKTSSDRPAVTVIAPTASKWRISLSRRLSSSIRGARIATTMPIGTLTQRTHSQPAYSVSMPPSSTPAAPPEPDTAPQTPSALLRSAPSANMFVTIDSAAGAISAAPRPCSARAAMSCVSVAERPPSSDAIENRTRPYMNSRRRPSRSAIRPPSSRKPPNVSA